MGLRSCDVPIYLPSLLAPRLRTPFGDLRQLTLANSGDSLCLAPRWLACHPPERTWRPRGSWIFRRAPWTTRSCPGGSASTRIRRPRGNPMHGSCRACCSRVSRCVPYCEHAWRRLCNGPGAEHACARLCAHTHTYTRTCTRAHPCMCARGKLAHMHKCLRTSDLASTITHAHMHVCKHPDACIH